MKKNISFITLFILIISLIINFWFVLSPKLEENVVSNETIKSLKVKYPLLSERILGNYNKDLIINFVELRKRLREHIAENYGSDFSFYFEYLPTGSSIGVNEKTEFYSASLLKLPLVMAYFYDKEQGKENLEKDDIITLQKEDIDSSFGDLWKKGEGAKLKSSEVVRLALEDSDNTAAHALDRYVEDDDISYIFGGLDITIKIDAGNTASITTKAYSSILKALFFSSLLSKDNSQHILDLLSKTKFNDKLPAGVPEGIRVSHKIGVYEKDIKIPIYSDCGIVYLPNREYILCMASRSDEKTASERMKTISKLVYDFVSQTNYSR